MKQKEDQQEVKELEPLSRKHQRVLDAYLACWNKTKAYKSVYKDIEHNSAKAAASRLFKVPNFAAHVSAALDAVHLSYEEALALLANFARGDIGDFLDDAGEFDLDKARQAGITHVIKEIERTETQGKESSTIRTRLKLHDPISAIDKVLHVQGKYKDNVNLNMRKIIKVTVKKDD